MTPFPAPKIRQKQNVKIPKISRIFRSKRYIPKVDLISTKVNLKFPKVNLKCLLLGFQNFVWGAHSRRGLENI